jgi:hypothetical protein
MELSATAAGAARGCGSASRPPAFEDESAPGLAAVIAELANSIAIVEPNSMKLPLSFAPLRLAHAHRLIISARACHRYR